MAESIVPCESVKELDKAQGIDLTVAVSSAKGALDGVKIRVTDKAGNQQVAPATAQFKDLVAGLATVEALLTPEQLKLYRSVTAKPNITKGDPAHVMLKLPLNTLDVTPTMKSDRLRAVIEGVQKRPVPIRVTLRVEAGNPEAADAVDYTLTRSRAEVQVFLDKECKRALAFQGNLGKLTDIHAALAGGKDVDIWAIADKHDFALTFAAQPKGVEEKAKPGKPATLAFKKPFEFLEGETSKWLQLVDSFESVDEIRKSIKRIRSIAALADMSADELANFAIKRLFIRKGVLDQPIVIQIDGKKVELKHPESKGKLPLRYSDMIVDRSGPKFLGALDMRSAYDTLAYKDFCISTKLAELKDAGKSLYDPDLIQTVRDVAEKRWQKLHEAKPDDYPELTESEIDAATSIFELKHMAQRRLSDFDLTARETETFSRAIANELLEKCGQLSTPLMLEIGKVAWSMGGPIDTAKINAAKTEGGKDGAKCARAYLSLCKGEEYVATKEMEHGHHKDKKYYHLLIHEVGVIACKLLPKSEPHVEVGLGLGIPYMGPQVQEKDGVFVDEADGKLFEIGDIICDETSHWGSVFSHNLNIRKTLAKLGAEPAWDTKKNLRDNVRDFVRKSGKADVAAAYFDRESFIEAVLMFEQVAKKEAQAQDFKRKKNTEKLLGNVSDVSQFLFGIDLVCRVAQTDGDNKRVRRLKALQDVVKMSCLIAFARWSIFASNVGEVGDTCGENAVPEPLVTAKGFAESINKRSYAHHKKSDLDHEAPRLHVEWANIDEAIAAQRLKDFRRGLEPVWAFIRSQRKHFENMDALMKVMKANGDRAGALKAIRDELAKILATLPDLRAEVGEEEELLLDALTNQAEQSCEFQVKRAPKDGP